MSYYVLLLYYIISYVRLSEQVPALAAIHVTRIVAVVALGAWAVELLLGKQRFSGDRRFTIGLALLVVSMLSIGTSIWRSESLKTSVDFAKTILIWVMTYHVINTPRRLKTLLLLLLALHIGIVAQVRMDPGDEVRVAGVGAFLSDANDFALALLIVLPFAWYLLPVFRRMWQRLLCVGAGGGALVGVVLSLSRGGLVALGSVLLYLVATARRKALGLAGLAALAIALVTMAPSSFWERQSTTTRLLEDVSFQGRLHAWEAGVRMMAARPVFGVGMGCTSTAFPLYAPEHAEGPWRASHNAFIQVGAELGFVGLAVYIVLIVSVFSVSRRLGRRLEDREDELTRLLHATAQAVSASTVGFAVGSLALSVAYYPHLYLLAALAAVVARLAPEEPSADGATRSG